MNSISRNVRNFFLDIFFPKSCLGCKKPGTYLCNNCLNKIEIENEPICFFCQRPIPSSSICLPCQKKYYLNKLIWAVSYSNPLIKKIIKIFKYHYVKELYLPLAQLLIKTLSSKELFLSEETIITPIPLHQRRLREREFNQSELLAKEVANHYSFLFFNVLSRKKYTRPQAKIKEHKTRKNSLKDVFEISQEFIEICLESKQNLLKDRKIILVDDVTTTGTTLVEAAKTLKKAGAKEVWGLVIAKG